MAAINLWIGLWIKRKWSAPCFWVAKGHRKREVSPRKFCGTSGCGSNRTQKSTGALRPPNQWRIQLSGWILQGVESLQSSRLVGVWVHSMMKKAPVPLTRRWQRRAGGGTVAPTGASPSMKGTSGAADRALLRGGAREAALRRVCESSARQASSRGTLTGSIRRRRLLRPALKRACDRRCPSRLGWG